MNEFDQFVKHKLKAKYYIRYADDFVFFSKNRRWLENQIPLIQDFLRKKLKLTLHPDKLYLKTATSGVDFLGWVHFTNHRILRTTTKKRMMRRLKETQKPEVVNSYLGLLKWGNGWELRLRIVDLKKVD